MKYKIVSTLLGLFEPKSLQSFAILMKMYTCASLILFENVFLRLDCNWLSVVFENHLLILDK